MMPIARPNYRDFWDPACGQLLVYANHLISPCLWGPFADQAWENAKSHSIKLLTHRYGATRDRKGETQHHPLFLDTCLMREIAAVWPEHLAFTTSHAGNEFGTGKCRNTGDGRMQWITMSQNYMVDRGAAVAHDVMPHIGGAHLTNDIPVSAIMQDLCSIIFGREILGDLDATSWLQMQVTAHACIHTRSSTNMIVLVYNIRTLVSRPMYVRSCRARQLRRLPCFAVSCHGSIFSLLTVSYDPNTASWMAPTYY